MNKLSKFQRHADYRRCCDDEFLLRFHHRPDTLKPHTMDGKPYHARWAKR